MNEGSCQLLLNGKVLDKACPLRFCNIPSHARITLKTGKEIPLGVHQDFMMRKKGEEDRALHARSDTTDVHEETERGKKIAVRSAQATPVSAEHSNERPLANTSQQNEFYIFSLEDEKNLREQESTEVDSSSIDYDVNEGDLRLLQASLSREARPRTFKTRKTRDQELQLKLERMNPVLLRIELPTKDMLCIQIEMRATDTVGLLYERIASYLVDDIADAFLLYIAPPKKELNTMRQTLYEAGLIPAARIKFAFTRPQSPAQVPIGRMATPGNTRLDHSWLLKPDAISRIGILPDMNRAAFRSNQTNSKAHDSRAEDCSRGLQASLTSQGGSTKPKNKVPKWMKLGK